MRAEETIFDVVLPAEVLKILTPKGSHDFRSEMKTTTKEIIILGDLDPSLWSFGFLRESIHCSLDSPVPFEDKVLSIHRISRIVLDFHEVLLNYKVSIVKSFKTFANI